jgi:hypothetical protein
MKQSLLTLENAQLEIVTSRNLPVHYFLKPLASETHQATHSEKKGGKGR